MPEDAIPHAPPDRFHLLAKPAGAACNLECAYCFFLDKAALYPGARTRMADDVLEAYIRQLIEAHRSECVTVAWQGGEPTLMGVDFFRRALELEERYKRPGMTFENTIQTNGTLLDDEWGAFLKEHGFLVGISVDGPPELHDAYRVDKAGGPTSARTIRGLRLLQKYGVDFNILTAVNRVNGDHPLEVYRYFRDELKADWVQFIPVVERIDADGRRLRQEGDTVTERSVLPAQWGSFLCAVFDEWVRHDVGVMFVQTFEATLRNWLRLPTSAMCVFDETCGAAPALEHNGDLYSCDHFVEPDYLLGSIREQHMGELVGSLSQRAFGQAKADDLPSCCRECDVLFACHGECPKNRFVPAPGGEPGLNYLCEGYKAFFRHVEPPMSALAGLLQRGRPAEEIMPLIRVADDRREKTLEAAFARAGRNDPCPCGSGLKFKRCHGSTAG